MQSALATTPISPKLLWTGRILSALPVLLLCFSGVMKLIQPTGFAEQAAPMGYTTNVLFWIGIVELACTLLYVIPQTAVLGAILLAAYLGGATATHVRVGDVFIMPVLVGVLVWAGLYLREPRLRALLPLRS
ncbi:MAG: DoxX family protein [Blastocatellia bacterium]|nr:DoxX family protein [Blastocatellia bacterium]